MVNKTFILLTKCKLQFIDDMMRYLRKLKSTRQICNVLGEYEFIVEIQLDRASVQSFYYSFRGECKSFFPSAYQGESSIASLKDESNLPRFTGKAVQAYIFVNCESKGGCSLISRQLKAKELNASALERVPPIMPPMYHAVAKVEVESLRDLRSVIFERIASLQGVTKSTTLLVLP